MEEFAIVTLIGSKGNVRLLYLTQNKIDLRFAELNLLHVYKNLHSTYCTLNAFVEI